MDTTELLVALGLFLFMILYWVYYILGVRRTPESEAWYDTGDAQGADSDGALYIFPYGSLIMGAAGAAGLVGAIHLPEPFETVFQVPIITAFIIGAIGFTGALGIPLPWPFVPRWVVKIRTTKRARARQRRAEKKANTKKSRGTD
ncbi:hypothetical protein [uncultured Brevibacterium sp.]|uniref:hypothetical protein n=1 Tax=uncultured Brevibacterium sp. TaxID=189678 RepID=UPI0025F8D7A5|nr:hypothetical protein [uncultured Brevibacterium sp.]